MPQVLTDPTMNTGVITNGGSDLFSYPNAAAPSILDLQTTSSQPLPAGTTTAANLLLPDQQLAAQLKNFPATLYDLTPSSVLMHFMQAMMGNAGAGQLRRRQMISRLQQAVTSTHFYDLDSFYGALFGAQRGPSGSLPVNPATGSLVNPYTDLASPDGWDEIQAIDATFRERIIALAKAITLGATVQGMQALGEAISGVPCQAYETWRLLATPVIGVPPGANTWTALEASYSTWGATGSQTWLELEGITIWTGLLANGAPNEIVIQPRKKYSSSVSDLQVKGSDMFGILSVAEVLKPAATMVSVSVEGPGIAVPVPIAGAWADSQYWEVVHLVTPSDPADPAYAACRDSYQGTSAGELPDGTFARPCPPFSRSQGCQYSYVADVTTVTACAVTGSDRDDWAVADGQNFETVLCPGRPPVACVPSRAVMPPRKAASARTSSPVSVVCAPYSGSRVPVMRAS